MAYQTMVPNSLVNSIAPATNIVHLKQRTREINNERIMQFQRQLPNESWECVNIDNDTNSKFNSFLCTFLNISEAGFPVKCKSIHRNKNGWITQEIKYLVKENRDSNDAIKRHSTSSIVKFVISYTGG